MYLIRYSKDKRKLYEVSAPAYAQARGRGLLYLEMVGPEQACRAIWAFIVKNRNKRSVMDLHTVKLALGPRSSSILIDPTAKYYKVQTSGGLVMFHSGFSRFEYEYVIGGDETTPSRWFAKAFQKRVKVPFLSKWTTDLWRRGIDADLLWEPEYQEGVRVWRLIDDETRWARVVQEIILDSNHPERRGIGKTSRS